jgi:hypothetical protein
VDFETLESTARRSALQLASGILEAALNSDESDHSGPFVLCRCGACARYGGRRPKTVLTAVGQMTIERAYYYCEHCSSGFCRRDEQLNLGRSGLSTAVVRMVGLTAALVSFEETAELLGGLAGIPISAKLAERTAEGLGKEILEDEQQWVSEGEPCSDTMYLGMDGTGVPMRAEELKDRKGKQPDGSAKTREVKLVSIWSADGSNEEGHAVRDHGSVSYNAAIESAATADAAEQLSPFAQRVQREATRRGFEHAARQVVLGDGAKWIWKMSEELFPGAIEIVDLYHAKGTLSDTAKAIFGADNEEGRVWAKTRRDELEDGKLREILDALKPHLHHEQAQTCRQYLLTNEKRMCYPAFRAAGLCVSSGVLEAGCKSTVGTRLKRAGMHWTLHGANEITGLRCCKLSGRYDEYWQRRKAACLISQN